MMTSHRIDQLSQLVELAIADKEEPLPEGTNSAVESNPVIVSVPRP